jgi:IS4 transposase
MGPMDIIKLIPEDLFDFLSAETKVDHKVPKLKGKVMFQLLLYTLLSTKKGSLRVMESVFSSYKFKSFYKIAQEKQTKYNSIRDRIDTIKVEYFERLFESCYDIFSKQLNAEKQESKIMRFDSTMVALSGKLLTIGMKVGSKTTKKQIKFTIGFDGLLPKSGKVFKEQKDLCEDITLRDAIIHSSFDRNDIIVFDRGLQSRKTFTEFDDQALRFVTRLKTNTLFEVVEDLPKSNGYSDSLEIISDQIVRLYAGKRHPETKLFRLIRAVRKESGEPIWFLTNIKELPAEEVTEIYKRRWDIEVFFKFLKQELNFEHILVRTENGVRVSMYMTLITAMLIIVYKHFNKLKGYKIPKLKFELELEREIIEQIVIVCGGNPNLMLQLSG